MVVCAYLGAVCQNEQSTFMRNETLSSTAHTGPYSTPLQAGGKGKQTVLSIGLKLAADSGQ